MPCCTGPVAVLVESLHTLSMQQCHAMLQLQEAIKSDCLVMLSAVFARFGEHVSPAWPVMQKLLRELATGGTATAKKAIPCIRKFP